MASARCQPSALWRVIKNMSTALKSCVFAFFQRFPMRFISTATSVITASLLATSLTACVVAPYRAPAQTVVVAPVAHRVDVGRVAQMELVRTQEQAQPTGAGAIIGGIAGAVIGHQIGGGFGRSAATVLGGVGGAVVGNTIENNNQQPGPVHESYRVTVQAEDGTYRYFGVPAQTDLRVGDRVRMSNGQLYRF
jgi:outer membrane lipoprotein SlyB